MNNHESVHAQNAVMPAAIKRPGRHYVLSVGIDKYPPGISDCEGAEAGADALEDVLIERYGFVSATGETRKLRGERATKRAIVDALIDMRPDSRNLPLNEDDSLIIYLAGEGGLTKKKQGLFSPVDQAKGNEKTSLAYSEIADEIDELDVRHVLLICDCCFSGGASNKGGRFRTSLIEALTKPSRTVLTSGSLEETDDVAENNLSTFTGELINKLRQNTKARLRISDFWDNLYDLINRKSGQKPHYRDLEDCGGVPEGEFVFFLMENLNLSRSDELSVLLDEKQVDSFDNLVQERTKNFIGRKRLTSDIIQRVSELDCGIIFVSADPGFGKTSWSAHLCSQHGFHRHFVDGGRRNSSPEFIRENLAIQVLSSLSLTEKQVEMADWSQGLWSGLCSLASLTTLTKSVLVIDGIDELPDQIRQDGESNSLYLFDDGIPSNIVIIAVGRRDDKIVLPVDSQKVKVPSRTGENYGDIRLYFERMIPVPIVKGFLEKNSISIDELIDRLVANSQGNFMYANLIVPHLLDKSDTYTYSVLDEIPEGLSRYYEAHWRKMKITYGDEWFAVKMPVLVELSINEMPISVDQITRNTGLNDRHAIRKVLSEWAPFIHFISKSQSRFRVAQYSIYHKSFRDYIGELDVVEDEKIHLEERRRLRALRNYSDITSALSNDS